MDETRTRFLAAIAKQLPAERIAEAHLFAAIRQGGVESGVAVIALEQEPVEEPAQEPGADGPALAATESAEALTTDDVVDDAAVGDSLDSADADVDDRAADSDDDSPYASADETEPVVAIAPAAARRYVVCTARYRHTLKGPDRGKWEVTVMEEADAPLLTVDAVVRGVQRRSGDLDETVRLSGDELRAALPVAATP